jgi:hypothetical protein
MFSELYIIYGAVRLSRGRLRGLRFLEKQATY